MRARALLGAAAIGAAAAAGTAQAAPPTWYVQGGGISHHFQQTQAAGREWQETHPGAGLEQRVRIGEYEDWDRRTAAGFMQDSRGVWSGYGGAAWMRRWQWGQQAEAGLGMGAYGFYKSKNWRGERAFTLALMPTASLNFMDNRVGVNLLYAPRIAALKDTMPSVLFVQLVVRTDGLR